MLARGYLTHEGASMGRTRMTTSLSCVGKKLHRWRGAGAHLEGLPVHVGLVRSFQTICRPALCPCSAKGERANVLFFIHYHVLCAPSRHCCFMFHVTCDCSLPARGRHRPCPLFLWAESGPERTSTRMVSCRQLDLGGVLSFGRHSQFSPRPECSLGAQKFDEDNKLDMGWNATEGGLD